MQVLKPEIYAKLQEGMVKFALEKDYARSSIREISKHAGISVGNIYHYYKNKEDLFDVVMAPVISAFKSVSSYYAIDWTRSASALVDDCTAELIDYLDQYSTLFLLMVEKAHGSRYEAELESIKAEAVKFLKQQFPDSSEFLLDVIVNNFYLNLCAAIKLSNGNLQEAGLVRLAIEHYFRQFV